METNHNCTYCSRTFSSKNAIDKHISCIWLHKINEHKASTIKKDIGNVTKQLPFGAINKDTNEYIIPKHASKNDTYICCECNKELIFCQGNIRVHYFRHKVDNIDPCHYYSKPSESQIHKDAKQQLKSVLEKKISITFIRVCRCCKKKEEYEIPEMSESSSIVLEHRFEHDGIKIADIAYLDNDELVCIFEICHTHKTSSEHRPEPWFEINATALINTIDSHQNDIKLSCIRDELCDECKENNVCTGKGGCLIQTEFGYAKNRDCKPQKCKSKYCNEMFPQYIADTYEGHCINCDMGFEPGRPAGPIYLNVPYSEKDEAKRMGARWCKRYKLWHVNPAWKRRCNRLDIDELIELYGEVSF